MRVRFAWYVGPLILPLGGDSAPSSWRTSQKARVCATPAKYGLDAYTMGTLRPLSVGAGRVTFTWTRSLRPSRSVSKSVWTPRLCRIHALESRNAGTTWAIPSVNTGAAVVAGCCTTGAGCGFCAAAQAFTESRTRLVRRDGSRFDELMHTPLRSFR